MNWWGFFWGVPVCFSYTDCSGGCGQHETAVALRLLQDHSAATLNHLETSHKKGSATSRTRDHGRPEVTFGGMAAGAF